MRTPFAVLGLIGLSAVPAAFAQDGARFGKQPAGTAAQAPAGVGAAQTPKSDPKVFPASSSLPTPVPPDQLKPSTLALPTEPVEPYLLTKDNGPFMVMARTFRGPDAEKFAIALVKEIRSQYGLPAYILRTKDFPNRSVMRNVPPLTPSYIKKAELPDPERTRSFDEACVLVGNCKTLDESEALWHKVKKLKPVCLNEIPSIFGWRSGLSTAIRTTNPYVATQYIFPGRAKQDKLVLQMNGGPRSVFNCPGRYTLQVAEFNGLASFNPDKKDYKLLDTSILKKSPLVAAADNAERVAETLAKDPEISRMGYQPYVYHDRTSSKVMVGAFTDPNDPNALKLRELLLKNAVPMAEKMKLGVIIAPSRTLTDLEDPNRPIKLARAN